MCFLSPIGDVLFPCCHDPLDTQTASAPMERVTKIFCSLFPWVATGVSALLFAATGHLVPLLGVIVFGTWSLITLIATLPNETIRSTHTAWRTNDTYFSQAPRSQTSLTVHHQYHYEQPRTDYFPQNSYNTTYNPPRTFSPNIFSPLPSTTTYQETNQDPYKRADVGRSKPVSTKPSIFEPAQTFTNPTEREKVGRHIPIISQSSPFAPTEPPSDPTKRAGIGRSASTSDTTYENSSTERAPIGRSTSNDDLSVSSDPQARANVGRKKQEETEETTATVGTGPTERAQVGRK